MATNGHAANGNGKHELPSFLQDIVTIDAEQRKDPADGIKGMPPNLGRYPVTHIGTFQGLASSISNVYRDYDEAIKASLDNARYMRNDCGIMESLEARQRATALLNWHLVPEDEKSQEQKDLCESLTKILERIKRFTEYRFNLLHALWYGKYAIQHRYGWQNVAGKQRILPSPDRENPGWLPINGDKLVFRFESPHLRPGQYPHQLGIRVGVGHHAGDKIGGREIENLRSTEPTDRGMAYFLSDAERKLVSVHKHSIEDGAFEDQLSSGMIHGVGIRSRIYWDWVQKQESLAFLIEYLERSAGGIELWRFPQGNAQAKAETIEAAQNRIGGGRNLIAVPVPPGEEGLQYGVEVIEPGMAGIESLKEILTSYFGHRIKRYILGQVLSSEAEATGMGSGVAELHWTTFLQIIHYDAGNLEETLTDDLLRNLQLWNFPKSSHIHLRFKIDTEKPDQEQRLAALKTAWEMGARIKEADVMEVVGASIPGPDDKTLTNPAIEAAQAQTEQMRSMGGMGADFKGRSQVAVPSPQQEAQQVLAALGGGEPDRYQYLARDGELRDHIEAAASETETDPSGAQRESGNYRKGKFHLHGLEIAIETPKGCERHGIESPAHYGYIRRHKSEADGDHVDVFIGPHPESEIVFIVDQETPGGRFDEHKVLLGFTTQREARECYRSAYAPGWTGLRCITAMTIGQFRRWLKRGDTRKPISDQVSRYGKGLFDEAEHPRDADGAFKKKSAPGVAGEQQGLFDTDISGQRKLFNVERPTKKHKPTKSDELAGVKDKRLRKLLEGKDTLSESDLKQTVQTDSLPGQRDLLDDDLSDQERSKRAFAENWSNVMDNPEAASLSDLIRARSYASGVISGQHFKAQRGEDWNRELVESMEMERQYLSTLIRNKEGADRYARSDEGRWITIGSNADREGGTPVYVKDGKILKGPKGLRGRTLKRLSQQSPKTKQRQAIREASKTHGVDRRELSQMVDAVWPEMRQLAKEREEFKQLARQRSRMTEADVARVENSYRDYSTVTGFDQVAEELSHDYPQWFGSGDNPSETLWELLREGKQELPAKHDEEVVREAVHRIQSGTDTPNAGTWIDGEHIPFSRTGEKDRYSLVEQFNRAFSSRA